jgi:hypothetical protein
LQNTTDEELIRQIEQIRADARAEYQNNPERIREQQQQAVEDAEFRRDYAFAQIQKVVINHKRVVLNEASKRLIESWVNPGEVLNADFFIRAINENPALADQLQWREAAANQDQIDRDTFAKSAKYRYAVNDANYFLLKSTIGSGFSQRDIDNAIATNQVSLAPPTRAEQEYWKAEDIEQRQDFLINHATREQLKAAACEQSEQTRAQEHAALAQANLNSQRDRELTMGFPQIPADITRERIRKASPSEIKYWSKRYGRFQLNRILAGQEN